MRWIHAILSFNECIAGLEGEMTRLIVKLQRDRDRCGSLTLVDAKGRRICGPFAVAGRSSDTRASANGNP